MLIPEDISYLHTITALKFENLSFEETCIISDKKGNFRRAKGKPAFESVNFL